MPPAKYMVMDGSGRGSGLDDVSGEELAGRLMVLARKGGVGSADWDAIQSELARRRVSTAHQAPPPRTVSLRSQVVDFLMNTPNSTPSTISRDLSRSTAVVSRVLAGLLDAKLVTYDSDPEDGRVRRYKLTPDATDSDDGAVLPPSELEEQRQYLGLVIAAAVRARRRHNDVPYAVDRLTRVLAEADASKLDDLGLIARRELLATLRLQPGSADDATPHLAALADIAKGQKVVRSDLVAPATACLDYELGRRGNGSERVRLEHLTSAATAFRRCEKMNGAHEWAPREGWARLGLAELWRRQTEFGVATAEARRAESVFVAYDDTYGSAEATRIQGFCQRLRGNFSAAIEVLERAMEYAKECSSETCRADVLLQFGDALRCVNEPKRAAELLQEAVDLAESLHLTRTHGFALSALSAVMYASGDLDAAWKKSTLARPSLQSSHAGRALNARRRAVIARDLQIGRKFASLEQSRTLFYESMQLYEELGSPAGIAACWVGLGMQAQEKTRAKAAADGLTKVANSEDGRSLLHKDPWIPALVDRWATRSALDEVRQVALSTVTDEHSMHDVDEMAGEPRRMATLFSV